MAACEYYIELISAGLDGQLSEEQELELANHLVTCPACREIGVQLAAAHAALGGMEEIPAPEGFSAGVMNRIRAEEAKKQKVVPLFRRPQFKAAAGLAACAVLCVGLFRGGLSEVMNAGNSGAAMAPGAPAASVAAAAPRDTAQYGLEATDDAAPAEPAEAPEAPPATQKADVAVHHVQYIRISWDEAYPYGEWAEVVSSADELAGLLEDFTLIDSLDAAVYDGRWFERGQLVAAVVDEPSGSNRHEVLRVDGAQMLLRRIVPEVGDCDMAAWLILAEVDAVYDRGSVLDLELDG